jgi:hypothetical protein
MGGEGGGWVVLGAAIGASGSLLTTWLNSWLSQKDPNAPYDAAASALLKAMLENGPQWRSIETLANVVGLDKKLTKEYLIVLGARGSETDGNLWGLVSRNPIPQQDN